MKRGFLLRAEKKDSATKRRGAQQHTEPLALSTPAEPRPVPQNLKGEDRLLIGLERQSNNRF